MNDNVPPPIQEIVSQTETEGLSAQIGEAGSPEAIPASVPRKNPSPLVFRRLSSFSTNELRKLKVRQEEFIRSLAARLSGHLRVEVSLKMSRLETMPFGKLIDEFLSPTYIALLKMDPLKGTCLLEIPTQLGLSIVDRELGGTGESSEGDRPLTEIESRILSRIVEIAMSEWCASWSDMLNLRTTLSGHESNGAFVQSHSPETLMLVVGVEMQVGELAKPIHFCFPYLALEPLIQKLNVEPESEQKPVAKTSAPASKWNPALGDVNIKITAEIPNLKITTKELSKLKAGDVILLEPEIFQNLRLSLGQKPKFLASAGRCGPRWAAKITKLIDP
jgi:flagellar motor switch protein FliM